ncbi:MAG: hypothetical protein ACJ72O_09340 [Marmoricola sp.]
MTTLHLYAEAAIRRDLARARTLLISRVRMSSERRRAVTEHLTWLTTLVRPGTERISPAAAAVRDTAAAFGREGLGHERELLIEALDVLVQTTATWPGRWTAEDVPRVACGNLPWVLDGIPLRGGPGLVLPSPTDPEMARTRAALYRRKRAQLWGPVALTPSRTLESAAG